MIIPVYPADLPPSVLSPLLLDSAVRLLNEVVDPEEDSLWRSLGDSWNIPRSRWPHDDMPFYIPQFYDGWLPSPPAHSQQEYQNGPPSRNSRQHFPAGPVNGQMNESPRPSQSTESLLQMRVIYDFVARNSRELSVMKGDIVQVVQESKQWWLVRNSRGENGNVPQNVLEPMNSSRPIENQARDTRGPVTLDLSSSPAEVTAWFQNKGFSKMTVSCLGVLNGQLLLGMTKDEIRTVCPEEAGRVFFQLQAVKAAIALASEPSSLYNGRY